MTVTELAEAFKQMVDNGHGEAEVAHVNGVGKAVAICGWQLVTAQSFEEREGVGRKSHKKELRLFTTSPF